MNPALLDQIIEAVLYEGYILYPYRASSKKNRRERFTFGRIYPQAYSEAQNGAEPFSMQTECLVEVAEATTQPGTLKVRLQFLQPVAREIGRLEEPALDSNMLEPRFHRVPEMRVGNQLFQSWHEALERRVEAPSLELDLSRESWRRLPFSFPAGCSLEYIYDGQQAVGVVLRRQEALEGALEIACLPVAPRIVKVRITILNHSTVDQSGPPAPELPVGKDPLLEEDRKNRSSDQLLLRTFASAHTILQVRNGAFISLLEPSATCQELASQCRNVGTWPVLVGDAAAGERDTMLSSPIILYDYPRIAPESAGPLFDGTEIDEILTLRIQSLTEFEKQEMRQVDPEARALLERTEGLSSSQLLKLHGTMREPLRRAEPASADRQPERSGPIDFDDFFGASTPLKEVLVGGVRLKAGVRVRIRPKARADILDLALSGQSAIIEALEQDAERRVHLALVLENDPGKDLGFARQPGHRFFFGVDEVEPLREEATP